MERRAKIKDIAAKVGVSPAIVSRALSGSGLVAEPTLTRVRETAIALDNRPIASARSLRTRRSMAVLMVVRDVGNPFYLGIFKGIEAAARGAGYSVLMGNTENDPDREAEYIDMLGDAHADGMILMTGKLPSKQWLRMKDSCPPVVVALEMIEDHTFPHILIDNEAAAREAVEHLFSLGHRRIANVAGPVPEGMSTWRLAGYHFTMARAGLSVPEGFEQRGDFSLESGQECCRDLLALTEKPTAIFAANDEIAFGVIKKLGTRRLSVPGDVSVIAFDDDEQPAAHGYGSAP